MSQATERRRKPRRRKVLVTGAIYVTLEDTQGSSGHISAKVVDTSDTGIGVETAAPMMANTVVLVKSDIHEVIPNGSVRAHVARCTALPGARYRIGLLYDAPHNGNGAAPQPAVAVADHYETLQVNAKADPDTIHRVYRLLAQRFHPDNPDTGDAETFRKILDAYQTLSDPEKRAAYDVHLHSYRQIRWKLFDPGEASMGKQAEKAKRRAILELLYTARMNQPETPSMSLHEFEDLLGCPREHLEMSLWYLRENGLLTRGDNGKLTITAKGVDRAEADELVPLAANRLLSAG